MGLKLVTDDKNVKVRVFDKTSAAGNSYKSYCLSVASKDKNNNWINGLINCNFPKTRKSEIADKTIIKINNAFPVVEAGTYTNAVKDSTHFPPSSFPSY